MKNTIKVLVVLCCLAFTTLYSQQPQTTSRTPQISYKGKSEWIKLKVEEQASAGQLAQNKGKFNLKENDELRLIEVKTNRFGHIRYQLAQEYKGILVQHATLLMHEDTGGKVETINGRLIRNLNLDVIPTISEDAALEIALKRIGALEYAWQNMSYESMLKELRDDSAATFYPTPELVIIDPTYQYKSANCRLSYKLNIFATQPVTNQEIYVDAHTGEVLVTHELVTNCTYTPATGVTNYYDTVEVTVCYDNGDYILENNIGGGMQVINADTEALFTDTDSFFEEDSTKAGVEALWAMEHTYRYFENTYGNPCFIDDCRPVVGRVHHGQGVAGAYPSIETMIFGDGDSLRTSFTSTDIVTHEMMHILIYHTANLLYWAESGALNESFADIFGEVVERYMLDSLGLNDWIFGAHIFTTNDISGIRSLSNPKDTDMEFQQPDTYTGDLWVNIDSECGAIDNCGVHTNSGVQNYWFYLLSQGGNGINDLGLSYDIEGIGMDAAAAIAYHNLTNYLISTSGYADAREGSIQAAIDLFGSNHDIVAQTEQAWNAVGVLSNRVVDSLSLVALYDSTNGPSWTNTWNLSQPMDTWHGVTVREGRVVCLDLDGVDDCNGTYSPNNLGNNLIGNLPPDLGNLDALVILSLGYNQLSGSIPAELGNLINVYLFYLNDNLLTGSIPPELGNLISVEYFALPGNELSGDIPVALEGMTNLEYLYLNDNQFTGRIPYWIGDINPTRLFLRDNLLDCYVPNLTKCCPRSSNDIGISDGTNLEPWADFCADTIGLCAYDTTVLPGDCNNDGVVDDRDFLYLSILQGRYGPMRPNATTEPVLQGAYFWTDLGSLNPVYGDGNGDGVTDINDDKLVIKGNVGTTVDNLPPFQGSANTSLRFELVLNQVESEAREGQEVYDLWLRSDSGAPIHAHGISGIMISEDFPLDYIEMGVSNSSLDPAGYFDELVSDTLYFSLSRIDGINQLIDGPIAFVVVEDLQSGGGESSKTVVGDGHILLIVDELQEGNGITKNTMVAESIEIPVGHTNFYPSVVDVPVGSVEDTVLSMTVTTYDSDCDALGQASVSVFDGNPPFTYIFNTSDTLITTDTIVQFTSLEAGMYTVAVSDNNERSNLITVEIDPVILYSEGGNQIDCSGMIVAPDLCVGMEGAYNDNTGTMNNSLLTQGVLPDQQPYHIAPWNYQGTEGSGWASDDYPDNTVDWVLVSFRTSVTADTQIGRAAAILQQDGCLYFPNGDIRLSGQADSVYVVIQHRNHIAVMTPEPIRIFDNALTYDFRVEDSYRNQASSGQKQLYSTWVMFGGDCNQISDPLGYDINGSDKSLWVTDNGTFGVYLSTDMNLDGDINGADKGIWFDNNGTSSAVPK